jgi:hypothetical protein
VTGVSAVLTLISEGIEEEFVAESTKNDLIELFLHKFVPVHFVYLAFALTNGTLTPKTTSVKRPFADILFDC